MWRGFISTIYRHIIKGLISAVEMGRPASVGYIVTADDVAVEQVEFNQARDAASSLGGQKGRAGVAKAIKYDICDIFYCISHQNHWLDCDLPPERSLNLM